MPVPRKLPLIQINRGSFFRHYPHPQQHRQSQPSNHPLFPNLSFTLPSDVPQFWCIVGPSQSGKTTFLKILQGRLFCDPPTARTFPYLSRSDVGAGEALDPRHAIPYVGFDGESATLGGGGDVTTSAYLSARYESRREATDFSLRDFLLGNLELNPLGSSDEQGTGIGRASRARLLDGVVQDLRLRPLMDLPVAFLSHGQGRRAKIAKALLSTPKVLLLDEPFMGLDPPTVKGLGPLLRSLADRNHTRLVLSARPQDPIPDWITHLLVLKSNFEIGPMGQKENVMQTLHEYATRLGSGTASDEEREPSVYLEQVIDALGGNAHRGRSVPADRAPSSVVSSHRSPPPASSSEPVVEMDGCSVRYGEKTVLGNWPQPESATGKGLVWTIRRGDRWGVFGPNGSGKTTIVSLLCSDHPQAYSLPIKLFGRNRLPEPGSGRPPLTFWDIQSRIGHSSPEVHRHMPRDLTVRQVLENAWSDTFRSRPRLDHDAVARVDSALRLFRPQLNLGFDASRSDEPCDSVNWSDEHMFGRLSFSAQRVALFLRAVIKSPDLIVLDEAFSGMDDRVRDKCMAFLIRGQEGVAHTCQGSRRHSSENQGQAPGEASVAIPGLSERQALVCISHVKEECPDCVREWLCLPEANSGLPARFGRLDGPIKEDEARWHEIWGLRP